MISPTYYNGKHTAQVYLGGTRRHYLQKDKTIVLTSYKYTVVFGDTFYSLASQLFGETGQYLWTIIGDINYLRDPFSLVPGETINLPETILSDSISRTLTAPKDVSIQTATI